MLNLHKWGNIYIGLYIYIYIYFRISRQYLLLAKLEEYSLFNAEYITILS